MKYALKIEGETEEQKIIDISETETIIKKVDFEIFQSEKTVNDRSENLLHAVSIEGVLTDKSQKQTKELLEWSKKTNKVDVYKTVSIKVYLQEEKIRDYYMKNMFCVSYQEVFNEYIKNNEESKESIGKFILKMKQRSDSIETIKVE